MVDVANIRDCRLFVGGVEVKGPWSLKAPPELQYAPNWCLCDYRIVEALEKAGAKVELFHNYSEEWGPRRSPNGTPGDSCCKYRVDLNTLPDGTCLSADSPAGGPLVLGDFTLPNQEKPKETKETKAPNWCLCDYQIVETLEKAGAKVELYYPDSDKWGPRAGEPGTPGSIICEYRVDLNTLPDGTIFEFKKGTRLIVNFALPTVQDKAQHTGDNEVAYCNVAWRIVKELEALGVEVEIRDFWKWVPRSRRPDLIYPELFCMRVVKANLPPGVDLLRPDNTDVYDEICYDQSYVDQMKKINQTSVRQLEVTKQALAMQERISNELKDERETQAERIDALAQSNAMLQRDLSSARGVAQELNLRYDAVQEANQTLQRDLKEAHAAIDKLTSENKELREKLEESYNKSRKLLLELSQLGDKYRCQILQLSLLETRLKERDTKRTPGYVGSYDPSTGRYFF